MTGYNSQVNHVDKDYRIQFHTDDYNKFRTVEEVIRLCIDAEYMHNVNIEPMRINITEEEIMILEEKLKNMKTNRRTKKVD